MDPQLDARLKALEAKVDENQKILLKVRRTQKAGHYTRLAYWAFIILAGFGAFYFIQPFLTQLGAVYGITGEGMTNSSMFTTNGLLEQIKQLKELNGTTLDQ